ncbi:GNAT family N-acetyltransferase [Gryllotalpicola daejeonensis]|uniref:GNAT family N-acetyltransferase n=1 Tax=Gryllotalpicola daejeonensis TaxID=993087 RepID=A0ABP7ZCR7_9MICO
MAETLSDAQLRIVPANEASWSDIQAIFGARGWPHTCQCQWFKIPSKDFKAASWQQLEQFQRELTHCDEPNATATTGLVAYLEDQPAGWVAVEPRANYVRMRAQRIPWLGRDEDKDDQDVWAITCFVTRIGFRGRGLMAELAHAAAAYARERGARAIEGYPLVVAPGERLAWGELFVGARSAFEAAGFTEVSRPTDRRVVMRIDF